MICLECQKETSNPKFCSRSCSVAHNNRKNPKRKSNKLMCLSCNKQFSIKPSQPHIVYCCNGCRIWHRFRLGLCKTSSSIKPKLVELYGNKCSICDMSAIWQNTSLVLILDHVDGNSDNNMPDNLRLVCPNCDSQLPTYKAKNIGKGRHKRRERYANGQSY